MPRSEADAPDLSPEWSALLDQELNGLPEKYRVPVILFDLEGRTHQEAAPRLQAESEGWDPGYGDTGHGDASDDFDDLNRLNAEIANANCESSPGVMTVDAAKGVAEGAAADKPPAAAGPPMYRTNIRNVPKVESLPREDGWVDMQVQFLIDKKSAGANHVVGWTVLKPGARHERHRHHNCDEFFIVIKGRGHIYSDLGEEPSVEGDVVYSPRGCWHGFNNTSNEDVVLVWGWMGAGSIEASGYEVHPDSHKG